MCVQMTVCMCTCVCASGVCGGVKITVYYEKNKGWVDGTDDKVLAFQE